MIPATQSPWDRLRAALDAWEAPVGLLLTYAIDERARRLSLNVTAEWGGGMSSDWRGIGPDLLDRVASRVAVQLDAMAFEVLRDHLCHDGRVPREIRLAARRFKGWVEGYRTTIGDRAAEERWQC